MKFKRLGMGWVLAIAIVCLASFSCVTGGGEGDDDDAKLPNFVQDTATGLTVQYIPASSNATSITYFSYVKNIGGKGKISMTIGAEGSSATAQFDVTAGTSYVFQATVPVEKSATSSYTYLAKFPGTPGYTDTRSEPGYHHTGAPNNMQMNPK